MLMTEIKRDSFSEVEHIGESILGLASRAKELLGYGVLEKLTGNINLAELTPLQTALKDLEIEVLRAVEVRTYQKERQIEQTKINFEKWLVEFGQNDLVGRFVRFDGPSWTREKIAEYRQPIPEFVLAKAVQIKERMPECEIWVESLQDHPDPFLVVGIPDHTYSWSDPKEQYYVEVWAEPKFEGRL